jgi:hypothetical protein
VMIRTAGMAAMATLFSMCPAASAVEFIQGDKTSATRRKDVVLASQLTGAFDHR